jgi:predicted aminopeptidase
MQRERMTAPEVSALRSMGVRKVFAVLIAVLFVAGCAGLQTGPDYYWQSIAGHLDMMRRARPLDELVNDTATDPALRGRLQQAREMRAFATRELGLPDNASFASYADLGRPFVLWNVFATDELSVKLRQWCFPVAGCVGYRGYYSQDEARRFASQLRDQGLQAHVSGVPAYSTLGWFADPLLSTFIRYPEGELARLVFHELAHQVVYVKGDTAFNESFATAVEEIGVERWFGARPLDPGLQAYRDQAQRRREFTAMLVRHKAQLETLFASDLSDEEKRRGRQQVFESLQLDYQLLKQHWGGYAGYDRWFTEPISNPRLAAVGAYNDLLPAFRVLFKQSGASLPQFYAAVKAVAALPKAQRDAQLAQWAEAAQGEASVSNVCSYDDLIEGAPSCIPDPGRLASSGSQR